jgi:hypothetical protein
MNAIHPPFGNTSENNADKSSEADKIVPFRAARQEFVISGIAK